MCVYEEKNDSEGAIASFPQASKEVVAPISHLLRVSFDLDPSRTLLTAYLSSARNNSFDFAWLITLGGRVCIGSFTREVEGAAIGNLRRQRNWHYAEYIGCTFFPLYPASIRACRSFAPRSCRQFGVQGCLSTGCVARRSYRIDLGTAYRNNSLSGAIMILHVSCPVCSQLVGCQSHVLSSWPHIFRGCMTLCYTIRTENLD